nr:MAG TPA: hypothetical protein [Siphoviridae sp. ct3an14]DAS15894.1 MAG TPA: hypothetical protein [Caudoviricetes sp.]DAS74434.1 MAG TPA: hypothetical protein [Caudoviricetes sp.]
MFDSFSESLHFFTSLTSRFVLLIIYYHLFFYLSTRFVNFLN